MIKEIGSISVKSIFFLMLYFFLSCTHENLELEPIEFGKVYYRPDSFYYSCIKNVPQLLGNKQIMGNADLIKVDSTYGLRLINYLDTINWKHVENWAYTNESIDFEFNNLSLKRYVLTKDHQSIPGSNTGEGHFSKWSDDLYLARYDLDLNQQNFIEFTSIDTISNFVKGKFEFHFNLTEERDPASTNFAKYISFTNGNFKAKLN